MSKNKKSTFLKDFKAFISKGNVLDLAVATIVGSAFSQIVTSFTNGIIMPLISLLFQVENLDKMVLTLRDEVVDATTGEITTPAIVWQYGTFIQAIVNFFIIAFFLFVLVRVIRNVRKQLDFDAQLKEAVQKKLDNDEQLTELESKWLARMQKKDPENAPVKTIAAEPVPEPAPEPTATEKMLAEIIDILKTNQK